MRRIQESEMASQMIDNVYYSGTTVLHRCDILLSIQSSRCNTSYHLVSREGGGPYGWLTGLTWTGWTVDTGRGRGPV